MTLEIGLETFIHCGSIVRMDSLHYLIGWGKRTWLENIDASEEPHFYFPDFFLSTKRPWFHHQYTKILQYDELLKILPLSQSSTFFHHWKKGNMDLFQAYLQKLFHLFSKGELKKFVPYIFEKSHQIMTPEALSFSLKHLLQFTQKEKLHVYGFWEDNQGMLGASPEILFSYSNDSRHLETIACAGTKNKMESFTGDKKEEYEHQLVIDGIQETLSPFGHVKIGQTTILQLPTLCHLVTPISVRLQKVVEFLSIVNVLHPTPALGAFPKDIGWNLLKSYACQIPRERFGAPVGYVLNRGESAKCIVGIRNVQWNSQETKIGAGCGIVADSQWQDEWKEIHLKISSIKEMLLL